MPPTPQYLKLELSAIEKTLHCPHNTLPRYAGARLDAAGMNKFPVLEIRAQAAQFRTAATTCTCWRRELEALNAARRDYGPVLNQSIKAPGKLLDFSWWQTEAYADVLNRAVAQTAALMGPVTKSVQESAYVSLLDHHVPVSLATLLLPRLRKHFLKTLD